MQGDPSIPSRPVPLDEQPDRNLVVLLLDVSESMEDPAGGFKVRKIDQLVQALGRFLEQGIHTDADQPGGFSRLEVNGEIAIAVFGNGSVRWLPLGTSPVEAGSCFYAVQDVGGLSAEAHDLLVPKGNTPMGEAVCDALDQIEDRKTQLHDDGIPHECRPNLLLLTDGDPSTQIDTAVRRLHEHEDENRVLFWAFGTPECKPSHLLRLANKSGRDPETGREWSNCNYIDKRSLDSVLQFLAKSYRYQPQDTDERSASDLIGATLHLIDDEAMPSGA